MPMDSTAVVSALLIVLVALKMMLLIMQDVDECESNPCHPNAICQNTEGSFTCTCNNNFDGDGFECTQQCANGFQLPTPDALECGQ